MFEGDSFKKSVVVIPQGTRRKKQQGAIQQELPDRGPWIKKKCILGRIGREAGDNSSYSQTVSVVREVEGL